MKWAYLPIIFFLAFTYSKFSFNSISQKASTAGQTINRGPANFEKNKIKKVSIKRAPSAALYKLLNELSILIEFQKVSKFKGTIIGNIYVESFGFIVYDNGAASFGLREFSDVSLGLYMHDVFGHLVSAKSIAKNISWINYFEAYKNGLQNKPHVYSFYVTKGLDEAGIETQNIFDESVSSDFPFEFKRLKFNQSRVQNIKKAIIYNHFKMKFPQSQFFDLYEGRNEKDYQMLVRLRPQDKIKWLELNEIGVGGHDQVFNQLEKTIPFEKHFNFLKNDVFDGKLSKSMYSITIDKKNYILKSSDNFSSKLLLANIPSDDYQDIILDEAYVLGKIHSKSLRENSDDYIRAWAKVPAAVIEEKMIELKYRLKDLEKQAQE